MLNENNIHELEVNREVTMYGSDFRSTFRVDRSVPTKYETTYGASFTKEENIDSLTQTMEMHRTRQAPAGMYDTAKNDSIGLITTLYCEQNRNGTSTLMQTPTPSTILLSKEAGYLPLTSP